MKESRTSKRRRVSDAPSVDEEGDTAMRDETQDAPAASPTPQKRGARTKSPRAQETGTPASSRSTRRQSLKGGQVEQAQVAEAQEGEAAVETPSRTGLRSSGRQRKAPQRYEDEPTRRQPARKAATPRKTATPKAAVPKTTATPTSATPAPKSASPAGGEQAAPSGALRKRQESEPEDSEEEYLEQPKARTRAKRASVRFDTTKDDKVEAKGAEKAQSPPLDDYQDGLEDLVSMQLQQDLTQQDDQKEQEDVEEGEGEDEFPVIGSSLPSYAEGLQDLCRQGLTEELRTVTGFILEKLTEKRLVPLKGLDNEYNKVHQLVEQTVTVGEGNSMLVLGSRGAGKTAIVDTIISSLKKEHKNDFHVVRLNGFLHTDDRLALRDMWRQLGRETNTEDDAGKISSYADTMATLLALLSHPEELFGAPEDAKTVTAAKSILIILDEFDLFVTHPRQTLLYNLFDIAQARKAPVAVLGLTTKVDVTEMLEKRVKSRFSHRSVFVPLPRTFDSFSDVCFAALNLEDGELEKLKEAAEAKGHDSTSPENWEKLLEGWRGYVQGLWGEKAFQTHLQRIYHQSKSVKEFFTSALIGLSELHYSMDTSDSDEDIPSLRIPTPTTFSNQSLSCPDPAPLPFAAATAATASSSSLPLSLLLAATRLAALFDPGLETAAQTLAPLALSFPAAYAEYVRLLTSAKTSASVSGAAATPGRVWGRDVAREAWEKLVSWGLISPVGGGSGTADGRMFRVEISFEEVVEMAGSGGSLGKWWRDG